MSAPSVTVLMPAYNAGAYIADAMASILSQTFTDFEFLIIDDGSNDNTLSIINSFSDVRIRVVSRPNKGLIDTLNEGLALARAPIIARMDADDISLPQRLEVEYNFLQSLPEYLVIGSDVAYIDKEGNYISRQPAPDGHSHDEIWSLRFYKCPFLHPTVMFRKAAVLAVGGYPEGAVNFEDWLLWIKLMDTGKVCNLAEVLVNIRLNPESVMIDATWPRRAFQAVLRSLQKQTISDEDLEQLRAFICKQTTPASRKGSYHALVAKKYLWDNPKPGHARRHLLNAIAACPGRAEPYALWLLSWLPSGVLQRIYLHFRGYHR